MDFCKFFKDLFERQGVKFKLYGSYLYGDEVFSDTGLMTVIVKRADRVCNICQGYGLGASFAEDDAAILNERVSFDGATPDSLRLFYIYDTIMELREQTEDGSVEIVLDDILYSV